jgi:hypothetical protein
VRKVLHGHVMCDVYTILDYLIRLVITCDVHSDNIFIEENFEVEDAMLM